MATPEDDHEALAGEYVLGTLAPDERRAAVRMIAEDATFRRAVARWEARLQPLADAAGEIPVDPWLRARVLSAISTEAVAPPSATIISLEQSRRRWQVAFSVATAAAAVLAIVVASSELRSPPQTEFVAVLTAGGEQPAFVATVDTAAGTMSIRRVGAAPPADKSYELWSIAPGGAPESLGVVEQASLSRPLDVPPQGDVTLAITLEPKGGSPTGAPTSAPVFSGALVATGE